MPTLKTYVITAHIVRAVRDSGHESNSNQATYGVAAPSRAAALRLFDTIKLNITNGFFKDYGQEWSTAHPNTAALLAKPGVVHWRPLDGVREDWTPIQ